MDFIDFISTALKDDKEKKLGNLFVEKVKAGDPNELLKWFHSIKYHGISLADCEKIVESKKNIIHNAEISMSRNY